MKHFILIFFFITSLNALTQSKFSVNIDGSYQFYNNQTIYLAASIHKQLSWPDWNIDLFLINTLYVEKFIGDSEVNNIYAIGNNGLWGIKYVYVGFIFRFVFEEKSQRFDLGPAFRVGYKFIWIEYSINYLLINNPFDDSQQMNVDLDKSENNIKLIVTIPIFKK